MARKFEVTFSKATHLKPSMVYVSPSPEDPGQFNVGVLHCTSKSGAPQPESTRVRAFDLKQNLLSSEQDAIAWAQQWLESQSGGEVTLNEVANET